MHHYSLTCFREEIDEATIDELINSLKKGIKVFFFSFDPLDMIESNEFLMDARKNQFLFAYEVFYTEELEGKSFDCFDGNVPEGMLELLSSQVPFFNREQYAIEHAGPEKNLMVAAGAGTGKTTVMINRIFYLRHVHPDMDFSEIGLVTFTNKAAVNMREKLIRKVKTYFRITHDAGYLKWMQEIRNMKIGTIHSFAYSLFTHYQEELFNQTDITIRQFKYRRKKIMEEVIDDFSEQQPELFRKFKYIEQYKIIKVVETMIDQMTSLALANEKIKNMDFGQSDDDSHIFYSYIVKETVRRLSEFKNQNDFLDVNDLIIELDRIMSLGSHDELPYRYIFIDEYQDTDRMQTEFFAYLSNKHSVNLFAVGDVKQSIYRFRGADYTAFNQLSDQTEIHKTYHLQQNYRTDKRLIEELNNLFSSWPLEISSFPFQEKDKLISGFEPVQPLESPLIRKSFTSYVDFNNFLKTLETTNTAILVRSNREVNELAKICQENRIYYTAEQDGDFYRSLPVREFYFLVHRFTHPKVWKNRYALHTSSYGERSIETNQIFQEFTTERNFFQPMLEDVDKGLQKYETEFLSRPVFEVLHDIISELNPALVYAERFLKEKSRLYSESEENVKLQAETLRKEYQLNLDLLIYLLKKDCKDTVPTLQKLEKVLRLKMMTDRSVSSLYVEEEREKRLSIMTVHKAKGLEFDYVFLPYTKSPFDKLAKTDVLIEGDRIGYKSLLDKGRVYTNDLYKVLKKEERMENTGEEARLLYVAMTRAKKGIYIDAPDHSNNHVMKNWGDLYGRNRPKANEAAIFT